MVPDGASQAAAIRDRETAGLNDRRASGRYAIGHDLAGCATAFVTAFGTAFVTAFAA